VVYCQSHNKELIRPRLRPPNIPIDMTFKHTCDPDQVTHNSCHYRNSIH